MAEWHSLYLPFDDSRTLASTLQAALTENGFELYDPFGLMPVTRVYSDAVKGFVSPAKAGWTRVILSGDTPPHAALIAAASGLAPTLAVSLLDSGSAFTAWHQGAEGNLADLFAPYADRAALEQALNAKYETSKAKDDSLVDVIPEELRDVMGIGSVKKAEGMLSRMAGRALSMNERAAAVTLLRDVVIDWASEGGQRIRAVMALLPLERWAVPDYVLLRDAYREHNKQRRSANARISPEGQKAMQAVPDALEYTPLFAGKPEAR